MICLHDQNKYNYPEIIRFLLVLEFSAPPQKTKATAPSYEGHNLCCNETLNEWAVEILTDERKEIVNLTTVKPQMTSILNSKQEKCCFL